MAIQSKLEIEKILEGARPYTGRELAAFTAKVTGLTAFLWLIMFWAAIL